MVDKKSKYSKYYYLLTVASIVFVGSLLLFFLAILPLYNKSKELNGRANEKKVTLQTLKDKKAKLDTLKDQATEINEKAKKATAALPDNSEIGRLFIELDSIASQSGGKLHSVFQAQDSSQGSGPTTEMKKVTYLVPTDFPNYFTFKDFLKNSQNALRILNTESLEIIGSDSGQMNVNIITSTYYRS